MDYVRWLAGEPETVFARIARLSCLDIDVEDTAEILIEMAGGVLGSIHLDMVDRAAHRACRIVGSQGTITWNGFTHQTSFFSGDTRRWTDLHPATDLDRNEMYVAELKHFIDCVKSGMSPLVTGEDGRRVLEIALAAKRSSLEGQVIKS
jgi:predicted dehydrogenase